MAVFHVADGLWLQEGIIAAMQASDLRAAGRAAVNPPAAAAKSPASHMDVLVGNESDAQDQPYGRGTG
jgi:hypothetical protein